MVSRPMSLPQEMSEDQYMRFVLLVAIHEENLINGQDRHGLVTLIVRTKTGRQDHLPNSLWEKRVQRSQIVGAGRNLYRALSKSIIMRIINAAILAADLESRLGMRG